MAGVRALFESPAACWVSRQSASGVLDARTPHRLAVAARPYSVGVCLPLHHLDALDTHRAGRSAIAECHSRRGVLAGLPQSYAPVAAIGTPADPPTTPATHTRHPMFLAAM